MTKGELLRTIRARFTAKLAIKTSWGRNEMIAIYDEVVREVLEEALE